MAATSNSDATPITPLNHQLVTLEVGVLVCWTYQEADVNHAVPGNGYVMTLWELADIIRTREAAIKGIDDIRLTLVELADVAETREAAIKGIDDIREASQSHRGLYATSFINT